MQPCPWTLASWVTAVAIAFASAAFAHDLSGTVSLGGQPVSGARVTLWRTAETAPPSALAEASTGADGTFEMPGIAEGGRGIYYLTSKSGPANGTVLLSVLKAELPSTAVVNELTSVASLFTNARFLIGTALTGNEVGLRIAAGNVPNLVDPATGTWGKALLSPQM
jgi:hypothetical protein